MKPPEILELEKELGFELMEVKDIEDVKFHPERYILNTVGEMIGINLRTCEFQKINLLTNFKKLELLNLKENQIKNISSIAIFKNLKEAILDLNEI